MNDELIEKAHMVLVWLGMGHEGKEPLLPEAPYQIDELKYRCLELRDAINKYKSSTKENK